MKPPAPEKEKLGRNQAPAEHRPATASPEPVPRAFVSISPNGEICAWGLEQPLEERLLALTGNQELATTRRQMAYELCG